MGASTHTYKTLPSAPSSGTGLPQSGHDSRRVVKAHVQPTFALAVDVGFPLLVILEDPLFEEGLIDIKRQIPVLGLFENGGAAADHRFGIDQVGGVERGAAGFTLVAIGAFVVAMRAGPHD